jgi:hypothetical protein
MCMFETSRVLRLGRSRRRRGTSSSGPDRGSTRRSSRQRTCEEDFFRGVRAARATTSGRDLATRALGDAVNQRVELRRVLTIHAPTRTSISS